MPSVPKILTKSRLSRRIGIRLAFAMLLIGAPVRAEPPPTVEFDVPYQLQFLAGGSVLEISGSFSWALPQNLQAVLADAPQLRIVRLESPGGHVQPAMQIAEMIRQRGLDTFVGRFCASACTIAFLGGRQRWLGPEARLGFHRARAPGIPSELANAYLRDSYQQLGVPAPFIARVLQTPPNLIWFPSRNELLGARLVTGVWTAAAQRSQGE